nr:NAD(P)/FAD-dependent oxidoreductase [uncultured Peptostreptococcus sp.]
MKKNHDLIVIGAGPAGIMASLTAYKYNNKIKIALVESGHDIGRKLSITGGGRCNFTNNRPIEDFFDMVVRNKKFLYSSFYNFTNDDLKKFVRNIGLDYIIEEDNDQKVYLKSGNVQNFIDKLKNMLEVANVDIYYGNRVEEAIIEDKLKTVFAGDYLLTSKYIIFACGGLSYPKTGSDGSILGFLSGKGYRIIEPKPALVPIETKEDWNKKLAGISIKNTYVWTKNKKKIIRIFGDIIFTHKGLGGPAILKLSSYINENPLNKEIFIDFLPHISKDELYQNFLTNNKKTIAASLKEYLPNNLTKAIIEEISKEYNRNLETETSANLSKELLLTLINKVKESTFIVKNIGDISIATISAGGVSVKDINPSSMESKLHPGVFFAGELIDVDALTGGYNLQIAFSTAYLAGVSVAKNLKKS